MAHTTGLMQGKRGLIIGVANNRSIAWGIAKACRDARRRARLHLPGRRAEEAGRAAGRRSSAGIVVGHCDVTDPATIDAVFAAVTRAVGHARLRRPRHRLLRQGRADRPLCRDHRGQLHQDAADLCYSFTAVAQRAEKLMPNGGSLLTLTYYGAEKWMPHYNVMGVAKAALEACVRYLAADLGPKNIRVNAISAGPIKTLAASRHRRLPLHPEVERVQRAAAPHRHHRGGRRDRALSPLRPVARRHRRDPPRRCRLPRRRHEEPRRAGHFVARQGLSAPSRLHATSDDLFRPPRRDRLERRGPAAGRSDIPLNDSAARRRALRRCPAPICSRAMAASRRFRLFVASPLVRARETWRSCARALEPAPAAMRSTPRLREIAFGDWEGLTLSARCRRASPTLVAHAARPTNGTFRPPGGESYAQVARADRRLVRDA